MELTVNLPVSQWYTDSPVNNASYWPLDYPPLSGYQSWLCGLALRAVEPAAVELVKSHGYETPSSKRVMRATVIAADLLVYIPACLAAVAVFYPAASAATATPAVRAGRTLALVALLFQPAAILIDHGHFQYNNIGLGLTLGALAAIGSGRRLLGSVLYCLALNHKQMCLFFAPAFFAHLLGWALNDPAHRTLAAKVLAVAKLALAVIATFTVCWAPYLTSQQAALQVLSRIFPVRRGLYEDYVANWWCASSVLIKWKELFAAPALLRAAAAATLAAAAPSMAQQIAAPSRSGLLRCLANSAFSFYMLSYQVHEKSILLPLLPLSLLAGEEPSLAAGLPLLAAFSMFPLLVRDGQALPYAALCAAYGAVMAPEAAEHAARLLAVQTGSKPAAGAGPLGALARAASAAAVRHWSVLAWLATAGAVGLHAARVWVPAPARLPWLHDRAFITYAFVGFLMSYVYLQLSQWQLGRRPGGRKARGKAE